MCKQTIGIEQAAQKRILMRYGHAEHMVTWQLLTDLHLQATTTGSFADALIDARLQSNKLLPCAEGVAGLQRCILETCWAMTRRLSPAT